MRRMPCLRVYTITYVYMYSVPLRVLGQLIINLYMYVHVLINLLIHIGPSLPNTILIPFKIG